MLVFLPIPSSPAPAPRHQRRPFIGPERHHDLKLKRSINPSANATTKNLFPYLSVPVGPLHHILILIVRMLLIIPPFPPQTFPPECDFICPSFSFFPPKAPSITRPPTATVLARSGIPSHTVGMSLNEEEFALLFCYLSTYRQLPLPSEATVQHKNNGLKD